MASQRSTAWRIANNPGVDLFYELRLSGLPYRVYESINPYASSWPVPWTLPAGVTAIPGLMTPDDQMEQSMEDILGGVCTPERIRLELVDHDYGDATSGIMYKFFGRLFATGRVFNDTSVKYGFLSEDVFPTSTTVKVRSHQTFDASGVLHIGGEAIAYSSVSKASNVSTFTISARNQYPAYTSADGARTFPPTPYYRSWDGSAASEVPTRETMVATVPYTIVGRIACLYVGHRLPGNPAGWPEAESQRLCMLIGRIQSVNYKAGKWVIELESVSSDLEQSLAAPDLPQAKLVPQIHTPDAEWRSFWIYATRLDASGNWGIAMSGGEPIREKITIDDTVLTDSGFGTAAERLCGSVMGKIALLGFTNPIRKLIRNVRVAPGTDGGRIVFEGNVSDAAGLDGDERIMVTHAASGAVGALAKGQVNYRSLLVVMGFPASTRFFTSVDGDTTAAGEHLFSIAAERAPPTVFVPSDSDATCTLQLAANDATNPSPGYRFDTGPGAYDKAYVRFGDGQVFYLTGKAAGTITVHNAAGALYWFDAGLAAAHGGTMAYYVPQGQAATVEQIIVHPDPTGVSGVLPDSAAAIWRLLCSTWQSSVNDGEYQWFNVTGVGLGWNTIVDKASFRRGIDDVGGFGRLCIVDSRTKWMDLFRPAARENHAHLLWDPETEYFTIRKLHLPTSAEAVTLQFTESNRPEWDNWTDGQEDKTMLRTGWTLKYGYSFYSKKYMTEIHQLDPFARAQFQAASKVETIEDPTLPVGLDGPAAEIFGRLIARSVFHRYPWRRYRRRVNLRGMLLAPGSVHKIVDATIHNPYTGVMGITSGDNIYGILVKVSRYPKTCTADIEFIVAGFDTSNVRPWSPCGLIDSDVVAEVGGGGDPPTYYGYAPTSKTIYFDRWYTNNSNAAYYDGIDLLAGDPIIMMTRDNDGAPTVYSGTVATVAADGRSCTLTTDPTAGAGISTGAGGLFPHWIVILQTYSAQTAVRQSGVSFMGAAASGLIESTARLNLFA
jgi:hypothetical protein